MTKPSTIIVRVAASFLPKQSRARYREQWLGELRDAPELGIRTSEIAVGSIAFAATRVRALPGLGPVDDDTVVGRSRLAIGLSLSAAIIAVSQGAAVAAGGFTGNGPYDFAIFTASMLLSAFSILAQIVALLIVFATRGVASRVRVAVALLVLASVVAALRGVIDLQTQPCFADLCFNPWPFTLGAVVYPVSIVLMALAAFTARHEFRSPKPALPPQRRSRLLLLSVAAGLLVLAAVALGFAHAVTIWTARPPLIFGPEFIESNRAIFEEWLTLKVQFETLMSTVFGVWLVAGIVGAIIIALSGLSRRSTIRGLTALTLGALCLFLISYGAILGFLSLAMSEIATGELVELILLIGRWGLVAVILVMIGGLRGHSTSLATARA